MTKKISIEQLKSILCCVIYDETCNDIVDPVEQYANNMKFINQTVEFLMTSGMLNEEKVEVTK